MVVQLVSSTDWTSAKGQWECPPYISGEDQDHRAWERKRLTGRVGTGLAMPWRSSSVFDEAVVALLCISQGREEGVCRQELWVGREGDTQR